MDEDEDHEEVQLRRTSVAKFDVSKDVDNDGSSGSDEMSDLDEFIQRAGTNCKCIK